MKKEMNTQIQLIQKIKEICILFQDNKNIISCGYTGSLSKGYADKYSDLDILIIFKDKPDYRNIYSKLSNINKEITIFNKGKDENYHFKYRGTTATIGLIDIDEINRDIKEIRKKFDIKLASKLSNIADIMAVNGDIKKINKLKKEIKSQITIPKEYIQKEFNSLYQWIINNAEKDGRLEIEFKRGNIISFSYRLNRTIGWLIQLIYLINGYIFQDARWAYKEIPKMSLKPKNCVEKLNKLSFLGNNPKEMNFKLNILRKLLEDFDKIAKKEGLR